MTTNSDRNLDGGYKRINEEAQEAFIRINSPQAVIETRESTHGNYTHQAMLAQDLKKLIRGRTMGWNALSCEQRESVDMICVKLSRIMTGNPNEPDHWTDVAGYATLISNLLTKGTHL